jgi:hypothetical protein
MEPIHTPAHYPVGSIVDAPTTTRELAPLPVATSAFDIVGKRAPEMVRPATLLALSEWQGVMAWPFKLLKVPGAMRVPIGPHQNMTPFAERVNVDMLPQVTLGSQSSIKAVPTWAPDYAKLGVWA